VAAFVQPDNPVLVKTSFLERFFQFKLANHLTLVHHTLLDERLADFGNVARVVDAVIVQFFQHAQLMVQVAVELATEHVLSEVEGTVING